MNDLQKLIKKEPPVENNPDAFTIQEYAEAYNVKERKAWSDIQEKVARGILKKCVKIVDGKKRQAYCLTIE